MPKTYYSNVGVGILLRISDNETVEYINLEGNIYTHKQIENRNGILYMRMKKRVLKV